MRGEKNSATGTSMLGIENPDAGRCYPRTAMEEKRTAHTKCGLVEGRRNRLYFAPPFGCLCG